MRPRSQTRKQHQLPANAVDRERPQIIVHALECGLMSRKVAMQDGALSQCHKLKTAGRTRGGHEADRVRRRTVATVVSRTGFCQSERDDDYAFLPSQRTGKSLEMSVNENDRIIQLGESVTQRRTCMLLQRFVGGAVEWDRDEAAADTGPKCGDEIHGVFDQQHDRAARSDAGRVQPGCDQRRTLPELPIGSGMVIAANAVGPQQTIGAFGDPCCQRRRHGRGRFGRKRGSGSWANCRNVSSLRDAFKRRFACSPRRRSRDARRSASFGRNAAPSRARRRISGDDHAVVGR